MFAAQEQEADEERADGADGGERVGEGAEPVAIQDECLEAR